MTEDIVAVRASHSARGGARPSVRLFCALVVLAPMAAAGCSRSPEARLQNIRDGRAYGEVIVKRFPSRVMPQTDEGPPENFEVYRETQARMVKSPFVLNAAVRDLGIATLALLSGEPHPIDFLERHIEVDVPAEEFLIVSFNGPRSKETAKIVNAVLDAYLQEVANAESVARHTRARDLEKAHQDLEEQIRTKTRQYKRLSTSLQTGAEPQTQKQRLAKEYSDRLRKEWAQVVVELNRDKVRLETLVDVPKRALSDEEIDLAFRRRLEEDAVAAALVARKSVVQLLLAEGESPREGEPREPPGGLERELAAIDKVLAGRKDELRRDAAARLENASAEIRQEQMARINQLTVERSALLRQLEGELDRRQVESTQSANWALEVGALRDEIEQLQNFDRKIVATQMRLRIEEGAETRVRLYRPAEAK